MFSDVAALLDLTISLKHIRCHISLDVSLISTTTTTPVTPTTMTTTAASPTVPTSTTPTFSESMHCQANYSYAENRCWRLENDTIATWDAARLVCMGEGGDLLMLKTQSFLQYMQDYLISGT